MKKILCSALILAFSAHAAERISFTPSYGNGYPEGVAWLAAENAFLVSSLRGGTIGLVGLDGRYRVFSADKRLRSTAGIVVDEARGRILAVNTDPGVSHSGAGEVRQRSAQVFEWDIQSGELRHIYDFSALSDKATLANDLTLDDDGNIYVTDSFQPHIYQARHADQSVAIWLRDSRLRPDSKDDTTGLLPNLNGIVYHPDGYLLAGDYVRGKLWRIPLDQPKNFHEVKLPARLIGPDGLRFIAPDTLAAVQTAPDAQGRMQSEITLLRSPDGWQSASIADHQALPDVDGATTATLKDGKLWVVNSHYPSLFAAPEQADDAERTFELIQVKTP